MISYPREEKADTQNNTCLKYRVQSVVGHKNEITHLRVPGFRDPKAGERGLLTRCNFFFLRGDSDNGDDFDGFRKISYRRFENTHTHKSAVGHKKETRKNTHQSIS